MLSLTTDVPTPFHRLPAALKLTALAVFMVVVMLAFSPLTLAIAAIAVLILHMIGGLALMRQAMRLLRPIWIFVVVIVVWHGLFGTLTSGLLIAGRIITLVAAANLVTMTTPLQEMMRVIAGLLRRIGVPAGLRSQIATAAALVISFVPQLSARAGQMRMAWRARSTKRAGWRLALPLALSAIDAADQVGEALRARGAIDSDSRDQT